MRFKAKCEPIGKTEVSEECLDAIANSTTVYGCTTNVSKSDVNSARTGARMKSSMARSMLYKVVAGPVLHASGCHTTTRSLYFLVPATVRRIGAASWEKNWAVAPTKAIVVTGASNCSVVRLLLNEETGEIFDVSGGRLTGDEDCSVGDPRGIHRGDNLQFRLGGGGCDAVDGVTAIKQLQQWNGTTPTL